MDEQRKQIPQLDPAVNLSADDLFIVSQNEGEGIDFTRKLTYNLLKSKIIVDVEVGATGATGARGADGLTGATGERGYRGFQGDPGPAGPQGPSGVSDKYQTVSISTLHVGLGTKSLIVESGLSYTANQNITISRTEDPSNHMHAHVVSYDSSSGILVADVYRFSGSGSDNTWTINLSGAVGAIGATGERGATGDMGPMGLAGATGPAGEIGPRGPIGEAGPIGLTGATGLTGSTGQQGLIGPVGATGERGVVGDAGPTGATGPEGSMGATGVAGLMGATGLAGPEGLTGATGLTGPTGQQGLIGPVGATGLKGETGATGPIGLTGEGSTGATGASGETGSTGPEGKHGATGASGEIGLTGSTGASGVSGDRYATVSSTFLTVGDGTLDGGLYKQTLTVEQELSYTANQTIIISMVSNPANHMHATVYSYNKSTGVLVATVDSHTGGGATASSWTVNLSGAVGITGATGLTGPIGATGPAGPAGAGGEGNLVFASSGTNRTLTGFVENGTTTTVRTAAITNGNLILTLAAFTPTVSASSTTPLNWDVAASSFTVTVDNPADVTDQYVNGVASIAQLTGSVSSDISAYTAGNFSATPAGGIDWNRVYTVNNSTSYIRSTSTTITGGSASGRVTFNYYNGSSTTTWSTTADFSVSWNTPSHAIGITGLTGKTFLQSYTSTSYTPSVTNISNTANRTFAITATNGNLSSSTAAGTLTFTTPIHKTNASSTTTSVSLTTTLNRPVNVTGTNYSVTLGPTESTRVNTAASFTYPTVWLWTTSTNVADEPTNADIVDDAGSGGFKSGVTQLGDSVKVLSTQAINNTANVPRAFWFAVRASASQPTTFKTGASAGLLSDVTAVDGGTVALQPNSPPSGYTAENYRIWGITLQPGTTYVSIS